MLPKEHQFNYYTKSNVSVNVIPITPDEIMVTMADPGASGASVTVTFIGMTFTETLDLV